MKNIFIVIVTLSAILLGWELFSHFYVNSHFVLPSPSSVFVRLSDHWPRFLHHTLLTVQEMLIGFLFAFVVAFPLAWIMDLFKTARAVLQPLFIVIQCIPMFALAPIMILWFGWSLTAIIVPTALMIFFSLTINIYQGLRAVPIELVDYFKINQATAWQIFFKLKLPWALPHIFGGFRIAAAIAGIAAVAGEWAGAQEGLGVLMVESRRDTDLETCFAALFCLTAISWLFYALAVGSEFIVTRRRSTFNGVVKKFWPAISVLVICILVIACGKVYEQKGKLRLTLDWLPNPNHVPLYVGIEKGFFQNKGINLFIQKLQEPGIATPYITSGRSDLALAYMPHTLRTKQLNVKPIAVLIKQPLNGIIYPTGKGIENLQDLNGKTIGYCSGGKESLFLDCILAENSISPAKTINVKADLVTVLGTGAVDALYGAYWNIETEHLLSLGIETDYFSLAELGVPDYYELIILAKNGEPQSDPDFISRFQTALQESIDFSISYPEEAFTIYTLSQPDKSQKTIEWEKKAWMKTIPTLAETQEISYEKWNRFESWLHDHKLL